MAYIYTTLYANSGKGANQNPIDPANLSGSPRPIPSLQVLNGEIVCTDINESIAVLTGVNVPANQWSEVQVDQMLEGENAALLLENRRVVTDGVPSNSGPAVCIEVDGPLGAECGLAVHDGGLGNIWFNSTIALFAGDIIRLESYGTTLTAFIIHNGVQTPIPLAAIAIPGTLASGQIGIDMFDNTLVTDCMASNFKCGGMYAIGDTMHAQDINSIFPATSDRGHTCDGIVYSGTLALQGVTGIIRPNTGMGDVLFPTIHAGESNNYCRAQASDFTYSPATGDRVQFIIVRTSAGDRLAKAITHQ